MQIDGKVVDPAEIHILAAGWTDISEPIMLNLLHILSATTDHDALDSAGCPGDDDIGEQGQCAGHGHCFSRPSSSLHGQPAEKNGALLGVDGLPVSEQAVQATGSRQNPSHNYWAQKMAVNPGLKVSQARPDAVALIQRFGSVQNLNFHLLFNDVP